MIRHVSKRIIFLFLGLAIGHSGQGLLSVLPTEVGAKTEPLKNLLTEALQDSAWPGGVLLAVKDGKIFFHEAFGHHTIEGKHQTRLDDIFDLASITKVIGTTSVVMKLVEEGKLDLDENVSNYLPTFRGITTDKSSVTIRHLITHTSGLPPFKHYFKMRNGIDARIDSVLRTELEYTTGEKTIYSDVGLITLGKVVEKIVGESMDDYLNKTVFGQLKMASTMYNPSEELLYRVVPTEYSIEEGKYVHGHVHDENANSIGGVAGHAGLFSTAHDLAVFSQMMLNKGIYNGTRIFDEETIELFTKRANVVEGSSRCLGWDSPSGKASGGVYLSSESFGHTGFTGTSLWIDPEDNIFVILLTNAVHPKRETKSPHYYDWRQRIHSAVYESLGFTELNNNLKLRNRWWVESLPNPWKMTESEASEMLRRFSVRYPDFHERLKAIAVWRIGTPYEIFKLGEEQEPDSDPIIRLDISDCTAHVLTSLAFAESNSWEKARENMIYLHYKDHQPSHKTRWHFTADRITSNPVTENITDLLMKNSELKTAKVTLNKKNDGGELLELNWEKAIEVLYIPSDRLDQALLNKIPEICGVAFVKKTYFKMGVIIAHEGMILDQKYLLHASQSAGETVKQNFMEYYFSGFKPKFDGIMIYEFHPILRD